MKLRKFGTPFNTENTLYSFIRGSFEGFEGKGVFETILKLSARKLIFRPTIKVVKKIDNGDKIAVIISSFDGCIDKTGDGVNIGTVTVSCVEDIGRGSVDRFVRINGIPFQKKRHESGT